MPLGRRPLLQGAAASLVLAACGKKNQGQSVQVPATFDGYRGLADLPWFEMHDGRLVAVDPDWPPAVDFHGHFGFGAGPESIDYQIPTERVEYLIDCDDPDEMCVLDFDVYINRVASQSMLRDLTDELVGGTSTAMGRVETHTVPNLLREMDDMGFGHSVILPVALGLIEPDDMTERFRRAINESSAPERFIPFCSVYPPLQDAVAKLQRFQQEGYAGLKFHPTQQRIAPDDDLAMALFEECDRLGMCVFFHAGRAGIELESTQPFAEMDRYIEPIETFPDLPFVFGHSGARDFEEAFRIAKQYDNVWLGIHGQGRPNLSRIVDEFDTQRVVFGSDWPFYPLAATLVKVLDVTQGDRTMRDRILSDNARQLLGIG